MKKAIIILFACLTFFNLCSDAQVSIGTSDLPKSGDKDLYISGAVDTINVTNTGAGYSWDFSYLKPSVNNVLHFKDPSKISFLYL